MRRKRYTVATHRRSVSRRVVAAFLSLALTECAPTRVALDDAILSYDRAAADSQARLLLLNIVQLHTTSPKQLSPWPRLPRGRFGDPFKANDIALLLQSEADVGVLLRLVAESLTLRDGGTETTQMNRPTDRQGYLAFRQAVAHLSSVQERRALHIGICGDSQGSTSTPHRSVITNYHLDRLAPADCQNLQRESDGSGDLVVDIRSEYTGGEHAFHGRFRLRNFLAILSFLGRGMGGEREFPVALDPRTRLFTANPTHTLEIEERHGTGPTDYSSVELDGRTYVVRSDPWSKRAFGILSLLFQMRAEAETLRVGGHPR